jgi:hypothetical protein
MGAGTPFPLMFGSIAYFANYTSPKEERPFASQTSKSGRTRSSVPTAASRSSFSFTGFVTSLKHLLKVVPLNLLYAAVHKEITRQFQLPLFAKNK